tara:strand:+ start:12384 stop:14189 length:1806 start_codon:yes stop_codon:yes gene_type:complete
MSILQKLTEGIVKRDMKKEGAALLNKWGNTGLLEGLGGEQSKQTMARLLENQAKELLREASTMAQGDVEGFAAVAFPIVRRVFGGLLANDLVSVQPMSLPSGLIFFMDFTFDATTGSRLGNTANESLYGGGVVGQAVTGGVDLTGANEEKSFYSLNNGYSSPTGSTSVVEHEFMASGTWDGGNDLSVPGTALSTDQILSILNWDPALVSGTTKFAIAAIELTGTTDSIDQFNEDDLVAFVATKAGQGVYNLSPSVNQTRRLTCYSGSDGRSQTRTDSIYVVGLSNDATDGTAAKSGMGTSAQTYQFPINDNFSGVPAAGTTNAIGSVVGDDDWGLENNTAIPEIDLKVDSVSVTAMTKKLKAKWTPELGQDLNAYHNLDAEVELTSILSEQIALEIDREILEDLIKGATAGTYYWSRSPGLFVNRTTGNEVGAASAAPDFTGTVSEWYETLLETVNDVSAQIHRKTLRGGANFLVTSPEVSSILEFTSGFRASVAVDENKGTAGAVKVGSISKKWDVYVDPYFHRNLILIGRKGSSFLESGYVYAPYVPLQVTPTIFGVEDFVPRKGVMTRYAKKMVRPDMYGLVVVRGLLGETGASDGGS